MVDSDGGWDGVQARRRANVHLHRDVVSSEQSNTADRFSRSKTVNKPGDCHRHKGAFLGEDYGEYRDGNGRLTTQYHGNHDMEYGQVTAYISYDNCAYSQHSMEIASRYQVNSCNRTSNNTTAVALIKNGSGYDTSRHANRCDSHEQCNTGRDGINLQRATDGRRDTSQEHGCVN